MTTFKLSYSAVVATRRLLGPGGTCSFQSTRGESTLKTRILQPYTEQKTGSRSKETSKELQYIHFNITTEDVTVKRLLKGLHSGNRACLAEAITLAESLNPKKRAQAQVILKELLEKARKRASHSVLKANSFRIGKSEFFLPV